MSAYLWYLVVQLVTESLPISSSGHLVLLGSSLTQAQEYLLHGPTVCMYAIYFYDRWSFVVRHAWRLRKLIGRMFLLGFCAESMTVIFYVLARQAAPFVPLWVGFAVTALVLFSVRSAPLQTSSLSIGKACVIGVVQGLAGLPGVSRLGATYAAGVWLGLSGRTAFLFSCMIQWPLMLGGFIYGVVTAASACSLQVVVLCFGASVVAYYLLFVVQRLAERRLWYYFSYYILVPMVIAAWC